MQSYRVIDLRSNVIDHETSEVAARTPEQAANLVLGLDLVRSGGKKDLVGRVYWQLPGQPKSMIRVYRRVG